MKNISVLFAAAAVLVSIATVMAENEKPVIVNQPTSVKAKVGDSVTFTVGAVDVNTKDEKDFTTSIMGKVDLDMVWCPPGTFMMGSPETEMGHQANETLHQVTLTKGFWIGKYEVTQGQYKAIMGSISSDISTENQGDNKPVIYVGRGNIVKFCDRLTQVERAAGRITTAYKYTLPTEAQWEYACRAGTTTGLNSGKELITTWLDTDANLDEVAWYGSSSGGNSGNILHEVGLKLPNAWGIYDMHGNAGEVCSDEWKDDLGSVAVTDPGDASYFDSSSNHEYHAVRGGDYYYMRNSHDFGIDNNRSARRYYRDFNITWGGAESWIGFRVVLVPVK